jgi:hypothetical protein
MPTIKEKAARRVAAGEFGAEHTAAARAIAEREGVSGPKPWRLNLRVPKSWPELPATAAHEVEVEWVHGEYERVVRRREGKRSRVMLARASRVAPSWGALGMLARAAEHPNWFYGLVLRVRGKGREEGGGERVKEERKAIGEMERLLGQMMEGL